MKSSLSQSQAREASTLKSRTLFSHKLLSVFIRRPRKSLSIIVISSLLCDWLKLLRAARRCVESARGSL